MSLAPGPGRYAHVSALIPLQIATTQPKMHTDLDIIGSTLYPNSIPTNLRYSGLLATLFEYASEKNNLRCECNVLVKTTPAAPDYTARC